MPLQTYFRVLLMLYAVLIFGELASGPMTLNTLPEPIRKFAEEQMTETLPQEKEEPLMIVTLVAFGLMFVSLLGLWFLWRPARLLYTLYLLSVAIAVVLA